MRNILFMCRLLLLFVSPISVRTFIRGKDTTCDNEGEPISVEAVTNGSLKDVPCYSCSCEQGIVICKPRQCPSLRNCPASTAPSSPSTCCHRCRTCPYLGRTYKNDEHWISSQDACRTLHCKAGVITIARMQCVAVCSNPRHLVGFCCPVCPSNAISANNASLFSDPCLQCTTSNNVHQHCYRTACPALDCRLNEQYQPAGRCCPECSTTRLEPWSNHVLIHPSNSRPCSFQGVQYENQKSFRPDDCTMCHCQDNFVICKRFVCPPIECPVQRLYFRPGLCCPFCRDRDPLSCNYLIDGIRRNYKHGIKWSPNLCTNCTCANGETKCDTQRCEFPYKCPRGYQRRKVIGKCCPVCEQKEATCTVFGDPHYRTFDGYAYTFQGTCRYVLAQECALRGYRPTFVIVAHNGPWRRGEAAWTKHVTIRIQPPESQRVFRISLLPKKKVKEQGRTIKIPHIRLQSPMYSARLDAYKNVVVTVTGLRLKLLWDGSSFVELTLNSAHQNRVCGLCGNYNNDKWDDTIAQFDTQPAVDDESFAQSWRWGSSDSCQSDQDRRYHQKKRTDNHDRYLKLNNWMNILEPVNYTNSIMPADRSSLQLLDGKLARRKGTKRRKNRRRKNRGRDNRRGGRRGRRKGRRKKSRRKNRRSLRQLCGGPAKWRSRRKSLEQCQLLIGDLFRHCRTQIDVTQYLRWCVQDACACPTSGRCFCDSLETYAKNCAKNGMPVDWTSNTVCDRGQVCSSDLGFEFHSCACRKSCTTVHFCHPDTCSPGCSCPKQMVEHEGRCISPIFCPRQ